jgi:ADP-ribosylglycohydrolase
MRVSPVGLAFESVDDVLLQAARTATMSHDHPEAIAGAQATALAVYMARKGEDKVTIRAEIGERFGYSLDRSVDGIRPDYAFDVTCQGSVPEAIICFLDSHDYEGAVRNAVSLGGDADTQAAIAGGIAAQHYGGVPKDIGARTRAALPADLMAVVDAFDDRFG